MPNRLASEQSPYLLQHKDNPVDWEPWGEDAFARARREGKPIFLSVGYSTCHWCHVMEHESFEHAAVAEVLNRHFVSIKVDREERPDVDRVYMAFVQATTGSGGWPMSVWLTPDLRPFYGGTYFPPTGRWGRPGFVEILQEIARVWRDEREKVEQSAGVMLDRLRSFQAVTPSSEVPGPVVLDKAVQDFSAAFDRRRGGFGNAPKFPRPSELLFLLREHARTGAAEPRDMALATLQAMALGGVRDHVGGGFHRYAVDGDWRVPHFEKMLYDQAQLVLAYVEAAQLTGDRAHADVALDTLAYVRRELSAPEGGFYSAEDADSVPPEDAADPKAHRLEGAFYVWRDADLRALLGDDAEAYCQRYGVLPDGNAPFDPQGEFAGRNLLYVARAVDAVADALGEAPAAVETRLARGRARLLTARASRPRPRLDDKVIAAWNGLMIAACARAGRVLDHAPCVADAVRAAEFAWAHLWHEPTQTLRRCYRNGDARLDGYAEDYAFMAFGFLELFQATGDPRWLTRAVTLHQRLHALFWDEVDGGWFSTTGDDASVLLRLKEQYDGAEPAASSVAALTLLQLAHLTGDADAESRLVRTFRLFGPHLGRAVPVMLAALSTYHARATQVVVVGAPRSAQTSALTAALRAHYDPAMVVVPVVPEHQASLAHVLPWTAALRGGEGAAVAYVCREFTCQTPTDDPAALTRQLQEAKGR